MISGGALLMSQAGQADALTAPTNRSWWPFVGAIALAVVVGVTLVGGYSVVVYKLRHSLSGREAVAQVKASAQLKALLGEPLKVRIEGGELAHAGTASFEMHVVGPKGSAVVGVDARAEKHSWRIASGTVTLDDGREIPLEPGPVRDPSVMGAPGPAPVPPVTPAHGPTP
jgi:hypothetical protein